MKTENRRTVPLSSILDLDVHELADKFPLMPDDLRKGYGDQGGLMLCELADSIFSNGLQEPIVLFMDQILDGRNRRRACSLVAKSLDLSPAEYLVQVADFVGTEAEANEYVLTINIDRRSLNSGQRAMIAAASLQPDQKLSENEMDSLAQRYQTCRTYVLAARKYLKELTVDLDGIEDPDIRAVAERRRRKIERVKAGTDPLSSLLKESRVERKSAGDLETTRVRCKVNTATANFKECIARLAEVNGQADADANFLGRRITDLIVAMEKGFGISLD